MVEFPTTLVAVVAAAVWFLGPALLKDLAVEGGYVVRGWLRAWVDQKRASRTEAPAKTKA